VLYEPAHFDPLTDEPWDPARQVERLSAASGRGRDSLWTGDVGTAVIAAACLDVDARYPILDIV
jgi:hypothetical protein